MTKSFNAQNEAGFIKYFESVCDVGDKLVGGLVTTEP